MNISTTTSTTTESAQNTNANDNQQQVKTEKVSDAVKTEEKKNENQNSQSDFQKMLEETKSEEKTDTEQIIQEVPQQQENINNQQYINKFGFDTVTPTKNIQSSMNFDTVKISKDDAKFFVDLVENKQFAIQQNSENSQLIKFADEIGPTYKSQEVSKVLTDLIHKAYNEQKPVRIDFDNNVSVILKVDAKGKISAEFIPGDKAVEAYLRNNIGFLKQRFDDQNISYNDILYRQSNNGNQNKERQNQQKNKGE